MLANKNEQLKQINYEKLTASLRPEYYYLFQHLGRVADGVKTLVRIREDVLAMLHEKSIFILSKIILSHLHDSNQMRNKIENNLIDTDTEEDLKIMNSVLKNLLGLWFSIGLLNVKRIDWNSPASLGIVTSILTRSHIF